MSAEVSTVVERVARSYEHQQHGTVHTDARGRHCHSFFFFLMRVAMLWIVLLSASTIPASVAKPVLRFSPAQIRLGEWVTVTWEGIPDAALNLKTSEYICNQDSYCRRVH